MKFNHLSDINLYERGIIRSPNVGKCLVCNASTNYIDIYSQEYFCSTECLDDFEDAWNEAFKGYRESEEI